MTIAFHKYHGLGNDFIVVDVLREDALTQHEAVRFCDRHFGVGADGVLLVSPSERANGKMTVLNADGSRPEMCGNGLRCVALHLLRRAHRRGESPEAFAVETDSGVFSCAVQEREGQTWISTQIGAAKPIGRFGLKWGKQELQFSRLSTGNPHAVLFDSSFSSEEIDRIGPAVTDAIDGGANVEFVSEGDDGALKVAVWERGVGRTLACGTGAAAVAASAAQDGRVPFGQPVKVQLPGGTLEITVAEADLSLTLAGPATHVCDGSLAAGFR